jgi:MFS family permease
MPPLVGRGRLGYLLMAYGGGAQAPRAHADGSAASPFGSMGLGRLADRIGRLSVLFAAIGMQITGLATTFVASGMQPHDPSGEALSVYFVAFAAFGTSDGAMRTITQSSLGNLFTSRSQVSRARPP